MPEDPEDIAYCHACGSPMNVAAVGPFTNVTCPSCGELTRVKTQFGPYTLVRRHAIGGMSMVFVAHDPTLHREVALKILSEEFSSDERRVTAFEEEARITASFSHPHVVRVLTTGKAFGRLYIAMELVPGGHFEGHIRERGKIPEEEMLPLAIEVAEGLRAAHAAGLIHRDIKPGNILLDAEGHAKIVDFGLALVTQGGKAQAAEIWATPYYVPPETIEGYPEDFRSDIYAFGATLYHALAGKPSCGEETMKTDILREAKRRIVPLGRLEPTLSEATCRIVNKAMHYHPADRYSSYEEMISDLHKAQKRLAAGGDALETSGNAAKRRARSQQTERAMFAAAGLVILASVGAGIWWVTRKDTKPHVSLPDGVASMPIIPESTSVASTDIAKSYREARAAVQAGDFRKASTGFERLFQNPEVQEPTRTWAGVEAVVAAYLDNSHEDAKKRAAEVAEHAEAGEGKQRLGGGNLLNILKKLPHLPGVPANELDPGKADAPEVMAWMLAGLKDWEQGMTAEAAKYFSAVTAANVSGDAKWVDIYQAIAGNYLADAKVLTGPVFATMPKDAAGCEKAVTELEELLPGLKTRGRAKFNVRAWQLDLTRQGKLYGLSKPEPGEGTEPAPKTSAWDGVIIMAKLREFAGDFRFAEATDYLKELEAASAGSAKDSLLLVTENCAAFLKDLSMDLAEQPATGEFPLKNGDTARQISVNAAGTLQVVDSRGVPRAAQWKEFEPDALISLHRILVKLPMSEDERMIRHERAISYDWLAGNRDRALSAASLLSQGSLSFKDRWGKISVGLPE